MITMAGQVVIKSTFVQSSTKKIGKNPIWNYFTMTEYDKSKVNCNICGGIYSLGSDKPKNQTTGNIKNHLKTKHHNDLFIL